MEKLGLCAIVKNEADYIVEWLAYHYLIGVRSFLIYDNASTDATAEVVRRWRHADRVTLVDWPTPGGQIPAYEDALRHHRGMAEWIGFIDCDEFIALQTEQGLAEILDGLPRTTTALFVHWLFFGSGGQQERGDGLVVERFRRRGPDRFYAHHCGKTIVRGEAARGWAGIHIVPSSGDLRNDAGDVIDQGGTGHTDFISHRRVALNHYFTKSRGEWVRRRRLGKADKVVGDPDFFRDDGEFGAHDVDDVEDLRLWAMSESVKAAMSGG